MVTALPNIRWLDTKPELVEFISSNRSGDRIMQNIEWADPFWRVPMITPPLTQAERLELEGFKQLTGKGMETVLYTPKHICIPRAYWGDKNNAVLANGTITSITNDTVVIGGLTSTIGPNRLTNPGFETGVATPWVPSTGVTVSAVTPRSGTYCLLLDKGAAGVGAGTQRDAWQLNDGIVAGRQYNMSAWIRGNVASSAGAFLNVQWRNAANGVISTSNMAANVGYSTAYQLVTGNATAPALATRALVYLVLATTGAAQTLLVDDVIFAEVTNALTLMPGDLVSFTTGAYNWMGQVKVGAVAIGSSISVRVGPVIPSYITVGATVRFKNPLMNTRVVPGSFNIPDGKWPQCSFELQEVPL